MNKKFYIAAAIICFILIIASPLASSSPDGLEKVAEDKGFIETALDAPYQLIADYVFPGIHNEAIATMLAGLIGTIVIFGFVLLVSWIISSKRKSEERLS